MGGLARYLNLTKIIQEKRSIKRGTYMNTYKKQQVDQIKTKQRCSSCVYYNSSGNCWALKGRAQYGKENCEYRSDNKQNIVVGR